MLPACFLGHGTFLYDPAETLARYGGDAERFASAMAALHMQHVWVRLHDVVAPVSETPTRRIIAALSARGVHLAGYGWCHGANPVAEAELATAQLRLYGLSHYVANIENLKNKGTHGVSRWTSAEIATFFQQFHRLAPPGAQVLISTYPFIGWHQPELMVAADPFVQGFAPQIYWFDYPERRMWPRPDLPRDADYVVSNPASYARMCSDMWRHYTRKPLVMTGQAYWSRREGTAFDQRRAEAKLATFLREMTDEDWSRFVGCNWWHFGHRTMTLQDGAMSPAMSSAISAARLDAKRYGRG